MGFATIALGSRYDDNTFSQLLRRPATEDGTVEALPRRTIYASTESAAYGLVPMRDYPELLPDPKDWKEIIRTCHVEKIFPMYHRKASSLPQKPSQNGLGHCWNYALTACVEDRRRVLGMNDVKLAPNSLAWLVNWRNQGYYLDATIKGANERGIAPASMCPEYQLNSNRFDPNWKTEALKFRPLEWWDTDRSDGVVRMIQQCLAILATGTPGYIAYNWWGHALEMAGMDWDESQPNNITWIPFNSHSDGFIELVGQKGVPDEFYGVRDVLRV